MQRRRAQINICGSKRFFEIYKRIKSGLGDSRDATITYVFLIQLQRSTKFALYIKNFPAKKIQKYITAQKPKTAISIRRRRPPNVPRRGTRYWYWSDLFSRKCRVAASGPDVLV